MVLELYRSYYYSRVAWDCIEKIVRKKLREIWEGFLDLKSLSEN